QTPQKVSNYQTLVWHFDLTFKELFLGFAAGEIAGIAIAVLLIITLCIIIPLVIRARRQARFHQMPRYVTAYPSGKITYNFCKLLYDTFCNIVWDHNFSASKSQSSRRNETLRLLYRSRRSSRAVQQ